MDEASLASGDDTAVCRCATLRSHTDRTWFPMVGLAQSHCSVQIAPLTPYVLCRGRDSAQATAAHLTAARLSSTVRQMAACGCRGSNSGM